MRKHPFLSWLVIGAFLTPAFKLFACPETKWLLATHFKSKPLAEWLQAIGRNADVTASETIQCYLRDTPTGFQLFPEAFTSREEDIRVGGIRLIRHYKTNAISHLVTLRRLLHEDSSIKVRIACIRTLQHVLPTDKAVLSDLLRRLKEDRSGSVRAEAIAAIRSRDSFQDPSIREYFGLALSDSDPQVRKQAASALECCNDFDPHLLNCILRAVDHETDSHIRVALLFSLRIRAPNTRNVLKRLESAVLDDSPEVRIQAAFGLARLGNPEEVTKKCIAAFSKEQREGPSIAAVFGRIGPRAIPSLRESLSHSDPLVRGRACLSLGFIYQAHEEAPREVQQILPALLPLLKDADPFVRRSVVQACGYISSQAEVLGPVLCTALADSASSVRLAAIQSLLTIGCKPVLLIPALEKSLLRDDSVDVRADAASALGLLRQSPTRSVRALIKALEDPQDKVRIASACALRAFEDAARPAIPALQSATHSRNRLLRESAHETLSAIDKSTPRP
jgi:HEAT repeat protein